VISVRYGAGRGGFSLARPRYYMGPGGYFSGNPCPAPIQGPPGLIPWTGPGLLAGIFNRDLSGVWVGQRPERGQGQGMPKNTPHPRQFSGAGLGKRPRARVFWGQIRPVTDSTCDYDFEGDALLVSIKENGQRDGLCRSEYNSIPDLGPELLHPTCSLQQY